MRWALVTGATGTVGRACAQALADAGLGLIVNGRDPEAVDRVVAELAASGATARPAVFELTDPEAMPRALAVLEADGVVPAVVVNSAGEFGPLVPALELGDPVWDRMIRVNLTAVIQLAGLVVPRMLADGFGRFIHISSAAALAEPGTGNAGYSVTKAAANRYLAHLAADLAESPVTVHALHPGEIQSRMWQHIRDSSSGVDGLEGYAAWADATGVDGDPVEAVGRLMVDLLDDETARRAHGMFLWAQHPGRQEALS